MTEQTTGALLTDKERAMWQRRTDKFARSPSTGETIASLYWHDEIHIYRAVDPSGVRMGSVAVTTDTCIAMDSDGHVVAIDGNVNRCVYALIDHAHKDRAER